MAQTLDAFISKWAESGAAERANKDLFLAELCDVLGVQRPNPAKGDTAEDTYVFERAATLAHEGGEATIGRIDLYKQGCFILEAKQASGEGTSKLGKAKRGTPAWNILMKEAYGQALGYARSFDKPEPFVIVCDIGHCFDLYATFDGTWNYRPFPNAQTSRIFLRDLAGQADTFRRIFEEPLALDPSRHAAKVTREVAAHIASLAKKLEDDGQDQELVAQFLMRCLFTMFAEDVGLLPEGLFTKALKDLWLPHPASFPGGVESLWRTMNEGGELFGVVGKVLRFNGGLFANPKALKLDKEALHLLLQAAECNWSDVEPAIFGTLLERALDAKERHALGAHYTPRTYVERLVRPTIEEPLRADWEIVQAQVRQIILAAERAKTPETKSEKRQEAITVVREFHARLCQTRVLDPACGSGNFLYVTLDLFKRLEGEILSLMDSLGGSTMFHLESVRVTPEQFHGIEIKRWAKEIAELVLWIGYLQWHFRIYGKSLPVPEPVLRDYKNIECRDAVLAYDGEPELVRDAHGKPITTWDGETMKASPVTGEQVPDETARVNVFKYKNPRKAEWPEADFIVGNPPFIGNKRMKGTLGQGYVETLRAAYPDVPEAADYVMYWWQRAAVSVEENKARRFGLITTNSITQSFNRRIVERSLDAGKLGLAFAIADHPWADSETGAAVRIAMTVGQTPAQAGCLASVIQETTCDDGSVEVTLSQRSGMIHADLSVGIDILAAKPLQANSGVAFTGMYPLGQGFVLLPADVEAATGGAEKENAVLRPFYIAKDLTQRDRRALIIDFYPRKQEECREAFPNLFQWVLTRVKPQRDHDPVEERRRNWWLFTRPIPPLREALRAIERYVLVPRTAKRFTFQFRSSYAVPDTSVVAIAVEDGFVLGVLSSNIHQIWATRSGGHMGVGNDPRYQHRSTFLPFPFPDPPEDGRGEICDIAEALDAHRKRAQTAHPHLTITGMYNVLEKLRSGEELTAKDKVIHEQGLVSVLKKLHDDLDAAVFDTYGWPHDLTDEQILERLVALNAERAAEERRGLVRWLRPDFQNPTGAKAATQENLAATDEAEEVTAPLAATAAPWPKKLPQQIAAIRDIVTKAQTEWTVEQVASSFKGAKRADVEDVLDSLAALGILAGYDSNGVRRWKLTRAAA